MLSKQPLVSFIMPTLNRPELLQRALRSVANQDYDNYEAIVINDAGQDVSAVVAEFPFARLINHERNLGLSAARNTGIKNAEGYYLGYLDDDDWLYTNHARVLVDALSGGYRAAYGDAHIQKYDKPPKVRLSKDWSKEEIRDCNLFPVCCVMHEASLIEETGLFDVNLPSHEDWDLWLRISDVCDFLHVNEITCVVDQSLPDRMGMDSNLMMRGLALVAKKIVTREREDAINHRM